jgi:hypothetical protein
MMDYLKKSAAAASTKLTTYVALTVSGLAMLPELVPQYWAQVEDLVPTAVPKESVHHFVLGVGALALIWTRIRREVKPQ